MKKFSFSPYLDLLVILYYIFTFIIVMLFFSYVIISDQLNKEIELVELELKYSQNSQNHALKPVLLGKLNILKEKETEYVTCKLKYLSISILMITLILIDTRIYDRIKNKKCWYVNFHKSCAYLYGNSVYNETLGD